MRFSSWYNIQNTLAATIRNMLLFSVHQNSFVEVEQTLLKKIDKLHVHVSRFRWITSELSSNDSLCTRGYWPIFIRRYYYFYELHAHTKHTKSYKQALQIIIEHLSPHPAQIATAPRRKQLSPRSDKAPAPYSSVRAARLDHRRRWIIQPRALTASWKENTEDEIPRGWKSRTTTQSCCCARRPSNPQARSRAELLRGARCVLEFHWKAESESAAGRDIRGDTGDCEGERVKIPLAWWAAAAAAAW